MVTGPIISSAVVEQPFLGWHWTEYLTGILQSIVLLIGVIFLDESYPPKLLVYKARRLRHESGNWALHAKVFVKLRPTLFVNCLHVDSVKVRGVGRQHIGDGEEVPR